MQHCRNIVATLLQHCRNVVATLSQRRPAPGLGSICSIVATLSQHCRNIVATLLLQHCRNAGLGKGRACRNIVATLSQRWPGPGPGSICSTVATSSQRCRNIVATFIGLGQGWAAEPRPQELPNMTPGSSPSRSVSSPSR